MDYKRQKLLQVLKAGKNEKLMLSGAQSQYQITLEPATGAVKVVDQVAVKPAALLYQGLVPNLVRTGVQIASNSAPRVRSWAVSVYQRTVRLKPPALLGRA